MIDITDDIQHRLNAAGMPLFIGFTAVALLIGTLGIWSTTAKIAGAVIASGVVVPQYYRQVIQHPIGGVVDAIIVRDGDRVKAGDVVLRLDSDAMRSELEIVTHKVNELRALQGRLFAERDDLDEIEFNNDLLAAVIEKPDVQSVIQGQRWLFDARIASMRQNALLIENEILQNGNMIEGSTARLKAAVIQSKLLSIELEDVQSLYKKGFAHAPRLSVLRREDARLTGDIGQLNASIAQLDGDILRLKIEKMRLRTKRHEDAISQLRELSTQLSELIERQRAGKIALSQMEIRTPVSRLIFDSRIFALNSVISGGEPIMFVVPQDQPLVITARLEAVHIGQVYLGQRVGLRFAALDQRNTPEIAGNVSRISADILTDQGTGMKFYSVEVQPIKEELAKLDGQTVLPGMPVDAFFKAGDRSPLSYLTKPFMDYFSKAFREE